MIGYNGHAYIIIDKEGSGIHVELSSDGIVWSDAATLIDITPFKRISTYPHNIIKKTFVGQLNLMNRRM